jgi:hypothetical protein
VLLVWFAPFQPLPHGEPPALCWGFFYRARSIVARRAAIRSNNEYDVSVGDPHDSATRLQDRCP